jgi:hypothetical protein
MTDVWTFLANAVCISKKYTTQQMIECGNFSFMSVMALYYWSSKIRKINMYTNLQKPYLEKFLTC